MEPVLVSLIITALIWAWIRAARTARVGKREALFAAEEAALFARRFSEAEKKIAVLRRQRKALLALFPAAKIGRQGGVVLTTTGGTLYVSPSGRRVYSVGFGVKTPIRDEKLLAHLEQAVKAKVSAPPTSYPPTS